MALPRTSIRGAVKARLVERLRLHLPDVQVEASWPRDIDRTCVWIGNTRGTVEIRSMRAGRKRRTDDWTTDVFILASAPGASSTEAEDAAVALLAAVEHILAEDPTLGTVAGLLWAQVAAVDGPDSDPTDEGYVAFIRVEIACTATLD